MPFKECDFLRKVQGLYYEDTVSEIKNRTFVCEFHAKNSICCEKVQNSFTSKTSIPMNTLMKVATSKMPLTAKPTTTSEKTISPSNEITSHPKYSVFKNIKCGVSTNFRISNGNLSLHSV